MKYKISNKWIVVFGAMSAQMAIGALYAWSLFNIPISMAWDLMTFEEVRAEFPPASEVTITYALSLVSFALTMIFSGRLQLKKGPRFTALIGAFLYSSGIIGGSSSLKFCNNTI